MHVGRSTSLHDLLVHRLQKSGGTSGSFVKQVLSAHPRFNRHAFNICSIHEEQFPLYSFDCNIIKDVHINTDENSFLLYKEYAPRKFVKGVFSNALSGLHSKSISAVGSGLIDEFNVGGGASVPEDLLAQDFLLRADGYHAENVAFIRGLCIPLGHYGMMTFGHFVLDSLLQIYLFRRELAAGDAQLASWPLEPWAEQVLSNFGVLKRQELTNQVVRYERAGLSSALAAHGVYFPAGYSVSFFEWLRQVFDIETVSGTTRIYVARSPKGSRRIRNEGDVEDLLRRRGFQIVRPQDFSLPEQARLFARSSVVVSPWGSTLTLAPLLSGPRTVIELLPDTVRDAWFTRQAVVHGLDYHPLLQIADLDGNMDVDLAALEQAVLKVL